jgi:hypothetical protein
MDNIPQAVFQCQENHMKVSVKRSGGFAGLTEKIADLETTQLDKAAGQQVEQLVQSLGFFNLPATISGGGIGADSFHYEITVIQSGRQHTIAFDDDDSPVTAPLRRFVEALVQLR